MTTETPTTTRDDLSSLNMNALRKKIKAERFANGESAWTPELEAIDDLNALREAHRAWRAERIKATADTLTPKGDATDDVGNASTPANDPLDLPALHLTQIGRECFMVAWPYAAITRINVNRVVQRDLAKKRVPAIASYVLAQDGYFGAAMVTVNGTSGDVTYLDGVLSIGPDARIDVNDGQHRIAGIVRAMEDEEFAKAHADDALPVVVYTDLSVGQQRQLFADVNLNAAKPTRAIALDYDERNFLASFAKRLIAKSVFNGHVSYTKQKLGKNDAEWFTFAAIVDAVKAMFDDLTPANADERLRDAVEFWSLANDALALHWEAKNYATNKNALVAVAKLRGFNVNWRKVRELDWALDGEVHRIAVAAGGTNAAVPALVRYLTEEVVEEA